MKKGLLLFVLIFFSILFGNYIGGLAVNMPGLEWFGREYTIGFSTFDLDLHVVLLTLGLQLKINICELFFLLISLLCYNKLCKIVIG